VPLKLFDSLSESPTPLPDGPVRLYVCGVTPYDTTHLGHAATFVQFDTLVRALRFVGREVTYVQNVTDIDDSILGRARRLGVDWRELGDRQTAQYRADMRGLNVGEPTHFVRATSAIPGMLEMIAKLVALEAAYTVAGGSVFFRVRAAPTYGELSKLSRAQMLEIAGQQDDADVDDPRKEDPLDFALWKGCSGGADEPCWPSPWGAGRPGWHIECSALCYQYLGPQVTIHGGGADLRFPHHESEIAQSERFTGVRPFVRVWSHVAMVYMDGAKMSKSLGNMVFVRDLLQRYSADALRVYLLQHRYRQEWEWSPAALDEAAGLAQHLARAARGPDRGDPAEFVAAITDDLDTPRALKALQATGGQTLRKLGAVLGLSLQD
jgi:L-cysteine:1D-myo-inositol 2-amino-2-deoxy-alpha-D-glucopyranoside ligase